MDTSQQYIKMCEKAKEIQDYRASYDMGDCFVGDYALALKLTDNPCVCIATCSMVHSATVWLPRQDQLQEMVAYLGANITTRHQFAAVLLENEFNSFCNNDFAGVGIVAGLIFSSMEQLWLAFVMKEKYQEIWSGKDWVKQEKESK